MGTYRQQRDPHATRVFTGPVDNGRFRSQDGAPRRPQDDAARSSQRAQTRTPRGSQRPAAQSLRANVHARPAERGPSSHGSAERGSATARSAGRGLPAGRRRVSGRRRSSARRRAAALAAACLAAVVLLMRLLPLDSPNSPQPPAQPTQEEAHSTPAEQWRRGEVPFLYQIDPQWADETYAGGTIRENGCGPTCLSMVYVALTGNTDLGPLEMSRLSEAQGHTVDGMTSWTLMSDGAASIGLTSWEVAASPDAVRSELQAGHPIICSVRPGDFTTTGHFIVLAGLSDDGQVIVRDPNNEKNSSHPWDLERVLEQCANLWAFSQ